MRKVAGKGKGWTPAHPVGPGSAPGLRPGTSAGRPDPRGESSGRALGLRDNGEKATVLRPRLSHAGDSTGRGMGP